jgi:predicted metalloprotease with PDZ domain
VPFDYSQENYTTLLWAFEGMTSYYDNLFVRRAGLMSANRYLNRLGETLTTLHTTCWTWRSAAPPRTPSAWTTWCACCGSATALAPACPRTVSRRR